MIDGKRMALLIQEQCQNSQKEAVKKNDYLVESERDRMEMAISVKVRMQPRVKH